MRIGSHDIPARALLAPMAGVTDLPFRLLCKRMGAAMTTAEMITSDVRLWTTRKTSLRRVLDGEPEPRSVQIAGADPAVMAEAAARCADEGAQIIDINMGCPAKKVCGKAAGSALLKDEPRVAAILAAVIRAARVPVTLKIRTGWDRDCKNGVRIARLAENLGIAAIAVHGRTRADLFSGSAEHDTARAIKAELRIPVIANGDIASAEHARRVLRDTGCDAVMLGRAAQGRPWIFDEVNFFLASGEERPLLAREKVRDIMRAHLEQLYAFYGDDTGVRVARKHLTWYCRQHSEQELFRKLLMNAQTPSQQLSLLS